MTPTQDDVEWDEAPTPNWMLRSGPRTASEKLQAGLRGLKHALRGDSSYFAHAYRGLLIGLAAMMLGVGPMPWCLLVIGATLVLMAELTQSALRVLAASHPDPDCPELKVASEIASAIGLVAALTAGGLSAAVLIIKFGDLQGWWG